MNVYVCTIKVTSGFGTPLKGDTIFGHIAWQAAYGLFGSSIEELLKDYKTNPFIVVSSAYPVYYEGKEAVYCLKRPDIPFDFFKSDITKIKDEKKKRWVCINPSQRIDLLKDYYVDDSDLFEKIYGAKSSGKLVKDFVQHHNTINRMTGTTGEDMFAPYSVKQKVYCPEMELVIFIGIDEKRLKPEQVQEALTRIGQTGFGKDASTGLGRFEISADPVEIDLNTLGSEIPNACYTLSPCVPEKGVFTESFFTPFVRFGRHGDRLGVSKNPFKTPVIMADEGAVFVVNKESAPKIFDKPYIGTAVAGISKSMPETVCQGYSLYIPIKHKEVKS